MGHGAHHSVFHRPLAIGETLWSRKIRHATEPVAAGSAVALARKELDENRLKLLRESSPFGRVQPPTSSACAPLLVIREAIEDSRHLVPELERYLRMLGTIAAISPFLGLLGTVL